MGSTFPSKKTYPKGNPKGHNTLFIAAIVLLFIVGALKWKDIIQYTDGKPLLSTKRQQMLEKKINELDEAEQYALIATMDGLYPCLHSGCSVYHLRIGEVWKYGVTTKGERGRYTAQFLQDNAVSYIIQFKGTMTDCLKEEQRKLFNYPLLPENLARPEANRLLRPPYNPVLR